MRILMGLLSAICFALSGFSHIERAHLWCWLLGAALVTAVWELRMTIEERQDAKRE